MLSIHSLAVLGHYHEPPADITPRPVSDFLLTPESLEVPQNLVYQPPVLPEPLIPPIALDFDNDWDTESSASDVAADEVDPPTVIMAEERTLLPTTFSGAPESDASEFWRQLTTYITYKGCNEADRLRLAKAMFTESACDWLESLPDEQKDSFDSLRDAFKERYIQPAAAREIFLVKSRLVMNLSMRTQIVCVICLKRYRLTIRLC